ncbi:MAG: glycoside hydrolase family 57 protein [Vicinamibacterales bacterium]
MTRVAILWHMHQPFYQDLVTGEHILPWVRLHALKDYWGMAAILREFPSVKVTFNLVPSLLVQLEAFAREEARDRHLELGMKPAESLSSEERAFCVEHFFHAHRPRMIDPYPRYAELLARRGPEGGPSARARAAQFSVDDIRDLQVWHKLAWVDPFYFDRDVRVRDLVARGRGFTEQDKTVLREVELELLRQVVPEYRAASDRGQIEISASPFYHPILPLLCDTDVFLRTHPQSRMPREPFRHPEDAAEQLARAVELHRQLFGRAPVGLWPSEGSVSEAMVPLVAAAGFRWMATDEEILARTLGRSFSRDDAGHAVQPEMLYRPYRVGGRTSTGSGARDSAAVACGFRDHTLSDLIGFTYSSWGAAAAADDFVARLVEAGTRYRATRSGEDATIFVILDGENAWEHYEGQGRPFLRALYSRLANHPELKTVTMDEACGTASVVLPPIFPGSWINGDFYIWIGHPDDHRGWSQLTEARRALDSPPAGLADVSLAMAREELLIAEGSDWFWWYGDDHSSDHDLAFDDLFRRHVRNVYRALDKPIPEELFVSNITTQPPSDRIAPPTGLIRPTIDGEVTSYFEWIGAGSVDPGLREGAMHQSGERGPALTLVEFGSDLEHLFVRLDGGKGIGVLLNDGVEVNLNFLVPGGIRVQVRTGASGLEVQLLKRGGSSGWTVTSCDGLIAAAGGILEIQVPFAGLEVGPRAMIALRVALNQRGVELEHHPVHQPIELAVPDRHFNAAGWTA